MAEIIKITPTDFENQIYSSEDQTLLAPFDIDTFLTGSSYIEFFIYDSNNNLLTSNLNYNQFRIENDGQSSLTSQISQFNISPQEDILNEGFNQGEYISYYNFLTKIIGNSNGSNLFISEISSDRKELRLDSNILTNLDIVSQTNSFIFDRENETYFVDFYLNFGSNNLIIANNIKLDNEETDNPTILVKLYEPLPSEFDLKNELWVVTTLNEPEAFQVTFPIEPITFTDFTQISGPNFNIPVKGEVNNSSQNLSYNDIISSASTSSQNQINSLLKETSINISVNYNDFQDFIHFSSVQTRIENFYYKVGLIEFYNNDINNLINITGSSTSQLIVNKKISNIIQNFDKFEYFMYYSSGSAISYPKSNSTQPYTLYSTGSSQVLTWLGSTNESNSNFGGQLLSASNYDNSNPDELKKAIPEYLREDPSNRPYDLFVDMVAQYYDNVWLYTKDITQKYNADNRLDFGVSKDLVSDAIKDFGVKLYQNNFSNKELYTAFLGLTPNGSTFPFPEITGSTPVSTGMEFVDTLISASNDVISMDDTNKSLYKRIYHNLPYLLKSKGTITGLRALITSYGIPDTILRISEFGGKDQVNANDYDLYFNNFNYAYKASGPQEHFINTNWIVNSLWGSANNRPASVQLRFKPENFPPTNLSQSLWVLDYDGLQANLVLEYNGSGSLSGSYSGSIQDPNYQYADLKFFPLATEPDIFAKVTLPYFDGGFWSTMIVKDGGNYTLHAANKIYNGNDGTSIGYISSSIVAGEIEIWNNTEDINRFASSSVLYPGFSGSLQEIRYYNTQISESVFKDYVMNPLSIEGNSINSAPDQLIFRAALGSELDLVSTSSIHPKITGSYNITQSFTSNSNFEFSKSPRYSKNTETFFLDQPAVGIKNRVTDKIRSESDTLPSGSVLSPIRRLSQTTEASASYTDNINYLEVAFSPQNQINDDIIGQLGHFNIGDYIGDPRQRSSSSQIYPDLNNLSKEYFKKYIKQYDLVDFVRLIKFFDNSLFKMIKDFIPARTSLASGLVVKQHLLERNKYPQPQVNKEEILLTGSINIGSIEGGAGGIFNPFNISYDLNTTSSIETTTFNFSANVQNITPPSELATTINFGGASIITTAPNLEYFERFISASYDGNPNLWMDLAGEMVQISNPFLSSSIGTRRARVADIDLSSNSLTLASGYVVGPLGAGAYQFTFYTASLGGSTNFQSSSRAVVDQENYYYDTTPQFNVTQSFTVTTPSLSGIVTRIHRSQDEFYNGELSGSTLIISNGELNEDCAQFKFINPRGGNYGIRSYNSTNDNFGEFIDAQNLPLNGFIQTWFQDDVSAALPAPNPSDFSG